MADDVSITIHIPVSPWQQKASLGAIPDSCVGAALGAQIAALKSNGPR